MSPTPDARPHTSHRVLQVALLLLFGLFVLVRVAAVYSEAIHWDEFALLTNASRTAASGELHAGGRPGLAVLVLLPLVEACADEVATVHAARLLWIAFTLSIVVGVGVLALQMSRRGGRVRRGDALLAVGLYVCVPAFLSESLQVRSDQLALAAGVWGGVALLASRARPGFGLLAGLLFGVGYLASQKLLYVGALVALLALGRALLDQDWRWRREALRGALVVFAMGAVVLSYPQAIAAAFPGEEAATTTALGTSFRDGVGAFEFYRNTIGYSQYASLVPMLIPHAVLVALLLVLTLRIARQDADTRRRIALAWAVLALGCAVAAFHAAAFAYFFMTLGLFPALAFGLVREPLLDVFAKDGVPARIFAVSVAVALAGPAIVQSARLLEDTQSNQRESLSFVARNFGRDVQGFHPEGALFCRMSEAPFPIYFSQHIYAYFGRDAEISRQSTRELISDFEERQVGFVLDSFRLDQFPEALRRFWYEHYQPYAGSVLVAGRYFEEASEAVRRFDLLVDGEYRWIPLSEPRPLEVDGSVVPPGGSVRLERGHHEARDAAPGYLVLALADPPGRADEPFYPVR